MRSGTILEMTVLWTLYQNFRKPKKFVGTTSLFGTAFWKSMIGVLNSKDQNEVHRIDKMFISSNGYEFGL